MTDKSHISDEILLLEYIFIKAFILVKLKVKCYDDNFESKTDDTQTFLWQQK